MGGVDVCVGGSVWMCGCVCVPCAGVCARNYVCSRGREREGEVGRGRERSREKKRQTDRQIETERQRDRERER